MMKTKLLLIASLGIGGTGCALEEPAPATGFEVAADEVVEPTLFRVSRLELVDPHVTYGFLFSCDDLTNSPLLSFDGVNPGIASRIENLEANLGLVFQPLDQVAPEGDVDLGELVCEETEGALACTDHPERPLLPTSYVNLDPGPCLGALPGTASSAGYEPGIPSVEGPCFGTVAGPLELDLFGFPVELQAVEVAATYAGAPATGMTGLVRGFLSEEAAAGLTVEVPVLGEIPVPSALPGGEGNCSAHDDRDVGPEGQSGWWFYLTFEAEPVAYTPAPAPAPAAE